MKKLYFLLFLLSSMWLQAQVKIKGTIIDQNETPLMGATVYLNNTTIGTSTDEDGYFVIFAEHGNYTLIVSFIGFETASYNLNTLDLPNEIVFELAEKKNQLNEVVLKTKWKSRRGYFLKQFQKHFLGESPLGKQARIKNKDAIQFEYDKDNNILEASAKEPLIIENKGLGYKITFDLVYFKLKGFSVSYLGFTRYENLDGSKRKQKKWKRERKKAYNGSLRNFLNAAINRETKSGFEITKVRLVPNPNPPPEEKILAAEEVLRKYEGWYRNPSNSSNEIQVKVKEAMDFLRKVEVNRFIEVPVQINLLVDDYFVREEDGMYLFIEDHENMAFRIKYLFEYKDNNYRNPTEKHKGRQRQISRVTLLDNKVLVNTTGLLNNPLDVLLEGYWAFEKVPDQLPLDYKPTKNIRK